MNLTQALENNFPFNKELRVAFVEKCSSATMLTAEVNKQIKAREDEGLQVLSIQLIEGSGKIFILFGRGASRV